MHISLKNIAPNFILIRFETTEQRFINTKSRVIPGITRRQLIRQESRNKLGLNLGTVKMAAHIDEKSDDS